MLKKQKISKDRLEIVYLPVSVLKPAEYNPRVWSNEAIAQLKESIKKYGLIDPLLVNSAPNRKNVVIGGNFRLSIAEELGFNKVPVVYINLPDLELEKELCIRLNKNVGEFDWNALADFGEEILKNIGFSSEELDNIFQIDENPEIFDLAKELKKLDIKKVEAQKGDIYQLGNHRMMVGDSTIEADVLKLMNGQKADMCFTDPPYILSYLKGGKRKGKATTGFGYKRDRRYLETDVLPPDFTKKWMANVKKVAKDDFSIIVYENWKNIRTIWGEMEKYWKVKNMIVWHLQNRTQGFAGKYKFFSKHDIAMVGTSEKHSGLNLAPEEELLQNDYETALYAISGHPQWESYGKGKRYCPTDFIEYKASDEKSSGQGIIFGTKPIEILIPYLKVLTKRDQLVLEVFGGSGSTMIACEKLKRRCFLMEKSNVYAEVIKKRWEKLTGQKAKKLTD